MDTNGNQINKTLSVIIPNYNKDMYIAETLDSILNQSFQPKEIIVVDDCSTDNSKAVLDSYSAQYPELIHVYYLPENHGVQYARNYGFKQSCSEYVTFIDSDDYYYSKEKLYNEMQYARKDRIVCSEYIYLDQRSGNLISNKYKIFDKFAYKAAPLYCLVNCLHVNLWPYAYIISRESFERVSGYDFRYNLFEDLDIIIKLILNGNKIYKLNSIGKVYRINDTATTHLSDAKSQAIKDALSLIQEQYHSYVPWHERLFARLVTVVKSTIRLPIKILRKLHRKS